MLIANQYHNAGTTTTAVVTATSTTILVQPPLPLSPPIAIVAARNRLRRIAIDAANIAVTIFADITIFHVETAGATTILTAVIAGHNRHPILRN